MACGMLCEDHAAVEGVQKEGVVYRGAYEALGEEFDPSHVR